MDSMFTRYRNASWVMMLLMGKRWMKEWIGALLLFVMASAAFAATAPGAPTSVTAVAGNAQATVTFKAPTSNGGSAITGYTVTSSPAGGVDTNAGTTKLSHVITGLTNGTKYTFTVKATNAIGTGPASTASASVTPSATVPGAPTGVSAAAGNAKATVTFVAPASDGGSPITGYTVTSSPTGGVDSNANTTGLSHVITGLTNGRAYTFTVKAKNAKGSSVASAPSNSVTPVAVATVPGAPTSVTAVGGNTQATVTFLAPTSNGGSAITGYTVISSPAGGVDSNAGTTGLSHVMTGLANGTAYTFTVVATNAIGSGSASSASNSVIPATVPDAPTGATAVGGNLQATVNFIAPVSDGGSAITGYTVTSLPAGGVDNNAGTTGLSHVITGLTNGTAYTFTVTAINAKGTSAASTATNSVTPGATVPSAPPAPSAGASGSLLGVAVVTVSWPASNGGSPITGYTVTSSPAGGVDSNAGSTVAYHTITGLTIGTTYTFTVTATNAKGTSAASAPSNSITMPAAFVPGDVTNVTAVVGNAQVTVSFNAPVSDGGSPITGYTVTTSPPGGVDSNANTTGLSHVITGLTNGQAYYFQVTAINAIGTSINLYSSSRVGPVTPSAGNPAVTTLESSLNPMRGDQTTLLAVKVTGVAPPGTAAPTGYVSVYHPYLTIANLPLTDGKVLIDWKYPAGLLGDIPASGVINLKAAYSGDANYAPSSAVLALTVLKSNSTTTLTSTSNPSLPGQLIQLTASLGPTNTAPRGTVTFKDGATVLGSSAVFFAYSTSTWMAQFNATTLSTGAHDLTAVYSGDVNNNASTSAILSQSVVTALPLPDAPTNVVAVAGACCNGAPPPTGGFAVVAFNAPAVNGNTGNSAITGYTVTSIPAGGVDSNAGTPGLSHTVTGLTFGTAYTFTVKATNSSGSSVASIPSNSVTPQYRSVVTTLTSSQNPAQPGQTIYLTVKTDQQTVGTITILDNGAFLASAYMDYVNYAGLPPNYYIPLTIPVSFGVEGIHNLTAYTSGDTNHDPSASLTLAQSIAKPAFTPTVTLTSGLNPSGLGQSVFLTAQLTGTGAPGSLPSGVVTFMDGATVLGTSNTVSLSASETKATFYATFNTSGAHNVTAVYAGNITNNPATSAVVAQTVNNISNTTTSLTTSLGSVPAGQAVTLTAAVAGAAPTGTVTFKDGSVTVGTGTLTAGQATLSTSFVATGTHSLTATYSGDTNNAASTSAITTQTITIGSSSTLLNVSANPALTGQTITLTATLTGALPSGTVTFKDGATTLGTSTVAAGKATLSLSFATAASHSLTAVYSGDANNTASTSAAVNLNVVVYSITYYHNDISATPMAETDATGNLVWKESYRPYGDPVQPPSGDNKLWFTGKPYDKDNGLTYMGARYYDPLVGRFMGVDPVGFNPGNIHSFNRYKYANNNPYKYVDPDGRAEALVFCLGGPVPCAYGVGISIVTYLLGKEIVTAVQNASSSETPSPEAGGNKESGPPLVGPSGELPNQGTVTGGVEGAPPVDAGKQGKHIPEHNNEEEGKSKWNKGENGVGETQEAWKNGTNVKPDGSVRIGQGSSGRKIKVHQDGKGNIHGYPTEQ